jgi:hypothetical protein
LSLPKGGGSGRRMRRRLPHGLNARFTDRSSTRLRSEEYRSSRWIRDTRARPARDVARSNAEAGWARCSNATNAAGG